MTYTYLANSPLVSQISFAQSDTTRMVTTTQFDRLKRLQSVASVASGPGASPLPVTDAYLYNAANQRTRATLADGSYWLYT